MRNIPSDAELSKLELDTYSKNPAGEVYEAGHDRAVITRLDSYTVVSFMGTNDADDWISNFKIRGVRCKDHPTIGTCEGGFLDGALILSTLLLPALGTLPVIVQGHSRGAGMVPIFASLMHLSGICPVRCIGWEMPWCVGAECRELIRGANIEGIQYWHGDDPVPAVPAVPWLVSNVWPIKHFGHWDLNPFACHFMEGIVKELNSVSAFFGDEREQDAVTIRRYHLTNKDPEIPYKTIIR